MKRILALVAAFVMTGLVALCMLAVGGAALFNPNSVPVSNSPSAPSSVAASADPSTQAQVAELQNEIAQYQQQLDQANAQLQDYQNLLTALQQRGLIRILSDGTIQIRGGGGR